MPRAEGHACAGGRGRAAARRVAQARVGSRRVRGRRCPDRHRRAVDGPGSSYDVVVLDLMLPGVNGYQLCATLREEGNWTPVLMLTAMDGELDEAEGLDIGADDF